MRHSLVRTAFVAALAIGSLVAATGCVSAASAATVSHQKVVMVLHDNANGKTVWVRPGEQIEVILSSSYWHVTGSSAPRVVHQSGHTSLMPRPGNCPHIPGLGCTPIRTDFVALHHGKAVIKAWRTTCGEALACTSLARQFILTVMVR
jgi:hypothetical protein